MVNDITEADEAFFYPPSNKKQTHSYVDAAWKATDKKDTNPGVSEIQFSAKETELRSIILMLQNKVRQLKGIQTPSTITDVSTPNTEASKLS
jgi:hypothetical protein